MPNYDIIVENVTKTFQVHQGKNTTLKEKILYAGREQKREFVALKNVSFNIERGSTVALIGKNGSGKSTLLKLMSRILYPDKGTVLIKGRVSSLLELGAGFHPDFTGVENIYMNGALLGLSRKDIERKFDEIVEFSELGDFLHEPVRNYSSGMYMRLAFSVAVAVDPEILLVDEILAVGDSAFQAKCISRIKQLKAENKTIVIVSHDSSAVERLCDTAIWVNNSRVQMIDEPISCVKAYLNNLFIESLTQKSTMSFEAQGEQQPILMEPENTRIRSGIAEETDVQYSGIQITDIKLKTRIGDGVLSTGDSLGIEVEYESEIYADDVVFGIGVFSEDGVECYGTNTQIDRTDDFVISNGSGKFLFHIPACYLIGGKYWIDVAIHTRDGQPYHYWRKARKIKVLSDIGDAGIFRMPHEWVFYEQIKGGTHHGQ